MACARPPGRMPGIPQPRLTTHATQAITLAWPRRPPSDRDRFTEPPRWEKAAVDCRTSMQRVGRAVTGVYNVWRPNGHTHTRGTTSWQTVAVFTGLRARWR